MKTFNGRFGLNKPQALRIDIGEPTLFTLKGEANASKVELVGNFTENSKTPYPMTKSDEGWECSLNLEGGKYYYYFLVDGKRVNDPINELLEPDDIGKWRNVHFVPNYLFELEDYPDAQSVCIAGNFNNWDAKSLEMSKKDGVWSLDIFLNEGTYAYKFVVDGHWITDPQNPILRPDGKGNYNSYISIGPVTVFKLYGHMDAREVRLAGNFNMWNYTELLMSKTESGWELHYALGQGLYEYKFIVEGEWIRDPNNSFFMRHPYGDNSIICIRPNAVFSLRDYPEAGEVIVSGSFNKWDNTNFHMVRNGDEWEFPICLMPGDYPYLFIVDGAVILDPENPKTTHSEYGADCSLLKIENE